MSMKLYLFVSSDVKIISNFVDFKGVMNFICVIRFIF